MSLRGAALSVSLIALIASAPALGGELDFIGTEGDGLVLIDPTEGVEPPGIEVITNSPNNDPLGPFNSTNGFSPNNVQNCWKASNGLPCDAEPKSGKRDKIILEGRGPLDLLFDVSPTGGVTEYFGFNKISNFTGARMTGFQIVVGEGTGDDFRSISKAGITAVQLDGLEDKSTFPNPNAATWAGSTTTLTQNPLQRAFYAAGLFGNETKTVTGGEQVVDVGFFTDEQRAALYFDPANPTATGVQEQLNAGSGVTFTNTGATTTLWSRFFGATTAMVDIGVVPEGIFWDNDGDPETDAVLMAAKINGQWVTFRARNPDGSFVTGIDADGDPIPVNDNVQKTLTEAEVKALLASGAYETGVVEDLSKVNANFSLDVGDFDGLITIRIIPLFAPIVTAAKSAYQWDIATRIDYGRVPYLGYDSIFSEAADAVEALPEGQRANAIERIGFGYLGAYHDLSGAIARGQMNNVLGRYGQLQQEATLVRESLKDGDTLDPNSGRIGLSENAAMFLTAAGSVGSVDTNRESVGHDYSIFSLTGGLDFGLAENWLAGLSVGYSNANSDIDDQRGDLDATAISIVGHTGYRFGAGGYMDAALGYSWLDYDSTRTVLIGGFRDVLTSDSDGDSFFGRINAGWDYQMAGGFSMGPLVEAIFVRSSIDGFTERGSGLAMQIDDQDVTGYGVGPGVRVGFDQREAWGTFKTTAKAAYLFGDDDDSDTVTTAFTGGGSSFETPVYWSAYSGLSLSAGLTADLLQQGGLTWSLGGQYDGLIGEDVSEHHFSLNARARF